MIVRRVLMVGVLAMLAMPARAADGPAQAIAQLNDGLLQVMKAGRTTPFDKRVAILSPIVARVFDLPLLLQNSVGPARWPSIPDAQKTQLMEVFGQFTVASYVANFDQFNGETFAIAADPRKVGKDVVVQTQLKGNGNENTRLDYVMSDAHGGWHVIDILLDGTISRVAVTRSDYRALLGQGDATRLIESLRGKVASLSTGTPQ